MRLKHASVEKAYAFLALRLLFMRQGVFASPRALEIRLWKLCILVIKQNILAIIVEDASAVFPSVGSTFKTKWWDDLKNDNSALVVQKVFSSSSLSSIHIRRNVLISS